MTQVSVDCATMGYPMIPATCVLINADWGYDCGVATGGQCIYQDPTTGSARVTFCSASGAGCLINVNTPDAGGGEKCTANMGTCTAATPDAGFTPVCDGTKLKIGCRVNQPYGFECAPGACTGGKCVSVVGGPCDNSPTGSFTCGTGLHCVVPDGGAGKCAM